MSTHFTRATINLDHLTHNLSLLQRLVGKREIWPAIKANAYGHGATPIAKHLYSRGLRTMCVAHVSEAISLREAGVPATFVVLSTPLPEHAEALVAGGCEPVICTMDIARALAAAARKADKEIAVHIGVDTGMGRIGIPPEDAAAFLDDCLTLPGLRVRGIMSHFPRADEPDKTYSKGQLARFQALLGQIPERAIPIRHFANSAAIFDLPASHLDAVRPGIALYGLRPSPTIANPRVNALRPILEWTSRITFLKEMPAGAGLSYGHTFHCERPSLIGTIPVGYGDGLNRRLSNTCDVLAGGVRCPQVGTITMDQTLIDLTEVRGQVKLGDEVVLIGRRGAETITADEIADTLGTINYEVVTAIAERIPTTPRPARSVRSGGTTRPEPSSTAWSSATARVGPSGTEPTT